MHAQSSLKSLAGAVLDRTMQRTLSAQYQKEPAQYPHIAQKIGNSDSIVNIDRIRIWLSQIGEPEEDHDIVLNKCRADPEALAYFLKHANGIAE